MKGWIYTGLIILLMALILPVFALINSPPGLHKATCSFVAEENPMIIADQLSNADHLIFKVEQNELKFTVVSDLIDQNEKQELPNTIIKCKESPIETGDRLYLFRKARDAL